MTAIPTKLERKSEEELEISWSDGEVRRYRVKDLRDNCPCATCREKRTAAAQETDLLPVLSHADLQPTRVMGMKPVGHYAYNIQFSDGHDTGIFTFELLRELGDKTAD